MFTEINNKAYNLVYIQSLKKVDDEEGYKIVYRIVNGAEVIELFNNEADRNKKYIDVESMSGGSGGGGSLSLIVIVAELPNEGIENKIYLVPKDDAQTNDLYDEYLWINKGTEEQPQYAWEWITTKQVTVDLSNYLAKDNITPYTPTDDYNPSTKKYVDDTIPIKALNIAEFGGGTTIYLKGLKKGIYKVSNNTGSAAAGYSVSFKYDNSSFGALSAKILDGVFYVLLDIEDSVANETPMVTYTSLNTYSGIPYLTNIMIQRNTTNGYGINTAGYGPTTQIVTADGTMTIGGTKTFSNLPQSSNVPTNDNQLVNKKYVDSKDVTLTLAQYNDLKNRGKLNAGTYYYIVEE